MISDHTFTPETSPVAYTPVTYALVTFVTVGVPTLPVAPDPPTATTVPCSVVGVQT